jgi:hypothetical protein
MECYVGLDVHSKASVFVIQDGRGQVLGQGVVPLHVVRRAPRHPRTTLKSPGLPHKTRTGPVSARRSPVAHRWLPDRLSSLRTLIAATRWLALVGAACRP